MHNNRSTTTTDKDKDKAKILLESGTNELEVLVFSLGDGAYGVNVAKVREVILPVEVTASPDQPDSVLGMFNLRNRVMPLVDLHHFLSIDPADNTSKNRKIIVTEFNGVQAAFQVGSVEQIYRISWTQIRPLPDMESRDEIAVTGITEINDRLVLMIDFESVYNHISAQQQLHIDSVENTLEVDRSGCRIMIAEDSPFIRRRMVDTLVRSGYTQIQAYTNGADAWQALNASITEADGAFDLVITDIEMPQMDGLALTRNIKSHSQLQHLPVLLFSSLITDDNRKKGEQVGADDQLAKPQLGKLVEIVDQWILKGTEKPEPTATAR